MAKLSATYRFLRYIGLNYSEGEYGDVSFVQLIARVLKTYRNAFLLKVVMNSVLLEPLAPRKIRPWVLRKIGCQIGKGVFIGSQVYVDPGYAQLITIEDNVHVTARCLLLCHERDLLHYYHGEDASKLKYKVSGIILRNGCMIGMNSMIMPGVTVGEGAIVGACSLITKDIPPYTVATGRPARVIRSVPKREGVKK